MTLREEYQASLKSSDTEEWFDLHFHRPLGFLWAKLFEKLGVSPNAITVASIFMGVVGRHHALFPPAVSGMAQLGGHATHHVGRHL